MRNTHTTTAQALPRPRRRPVLSTLLVLAAAHFGMTALAAVAIVASGQTHLLTQVTLTMLVMGVPIVVGIPLVQRLPPPREYSGHEWR